MSIIRAMQAEWKTMTTAEKVKTVLDLVVDLGCSVIAGDITARAVKGKNKALRVCGAIAGSALGSAAAGVASREVDKLVDGVDAMMKMRKQAKEGSANA